MHTHTIGVEQLTGDGSLAAVERFDGDVVKICATDSDIAADASRRGLNVGEYLRGVAANYARTYGAELI